MAAFHYTDKDQSGPDPTRHIRAFDQVSDRSGPYQIPLQGSDPTGDSTIEIKIHHYCEWMNEINDALQVTYYYYYYNAATLAAIFGFSSVNYY